MATSETRERYDAFIEKLKSDPGAGRGTATTSVRVAGGVACAVEDGPWRLVVDDMPGDGGQGLGPDPGVLIRAGLAACLAQGYVVWAEYFGVPLDSVNVTVEADYDARGMLDVDGAIAPGWSAVRYRIEIESPADEARVREVVAHADRLSSVRHIIAAATPIEANVNVKHT